MMKLLNVKPERITYSDLSKIPSDYTDKMNREYNWMAKGYDGFDYEVLSVDGFGSIQLFIANKKNKDHEKSRSLHKCKKEG